MKNIDFQITPPVNPEDTKPIQAKADGNGDAACVCGCKPALGDGTSVYLSGSVTLGG